MAFRWMKSLHLLHSLESWEMKGAIDEGLKISEMKAWDFLGFESFESKVARKFQAFWKATVGRIKIVGLCLINAHSGISQEDSVFVFKSVLLLQGRGLNQGVWVDDLKSEGQCLGLKYRFRLSLELFSAQRPYVGVARGHPEKPIHAVVTEVHEFAKASVREEKRDLSEAKALESVDLLPGFLSSGHTDKKTMSGERELEGAASSESAAEGVFGERKNFNFLRVIVDLPSLAEQDKEDILKRGVPNKMLSKELPHLHKNSPKGCGGVRLSPQSNTHYSTILATMVQVALLITNAMTDTLVHA
ncbi:hypothetical protein ACFX1S_034040 [Malus domestica]